jgi:hypothetical protein
MPADFGNSLSVSTGSMCRSNFSLTHVEPRTIGISSSHLEGTGSPEALDMIGSFTGHAMFPAV